MSEGLVTQLATTLIGNLTALDVQDAFRMNMPPKPRGQVIVRGRDRLWARENRLVSRGCQTVFSSSPGL